MQFPNVLRTILDRVDVAILSRSQAVVPCTADRRGQKDVVSPNDGTGMTKAGNFCFPTNVFTGLDVPTDWRMLAVGDSRTVQTTKRRPVLWRTDNFILFIFAWILFFVGGLGFNAIVLRFSLSRLDRQS